jgi:hypothetical protein
LTPKPKLNYNFRARTEIPIDTFVFPQECLTAISARDVFCPKMHREIFVLPKKASRGKEFFSVEKKRKFRPYEKDLATGQFVFQSNQN